MSELAVYDRMCTAIADCHRIDEVKDMRDKARALEVYAKQAQNVDAERKATEVRLRAERRTGELLSELQKAPGKRTDKPQATVATGSAYRAAIEAAGIPERTATRYQQLANVPAPVFEQALRSPQAKPTTNGILRAANGATRMDDGSLWLWGRLRDVERDGLLNREAADVFGGMTESMLATCDDFCL